MRTGPALLLVVLVAVLPAVRAPAFIETHLNEITEPVAAASTVRVAQLEAQPSLTKSEKKERKQLAKIVKKTAKDVTRLGKDFAELKKVGAAAKALGLAILSIETALDETFGRAELALGERRELTDDHLALVTDVKQRGKVQKLLDKYAAARTAADAATDPKTRAKQLAKAEKFLTKALKKAEKFAQLAVNASTTGLTMPPVRLRSGDQVGSGGARVAVPAEADSPIARAAVLIPPGSLGSLTRITIEPADDIVGGRDQPVGPAVRFLPGGTQFSQPVRVAVPYLLPGDADPSDVALFHFDGADTEATLDVVIEPNATLSAEFTSFSEFQAGLLAPPLGAPDGIYRVKTLVLLHELDPDDLDESELNAEIFDQELTFRPDTTGGAALGAASVVERQFLSAAPHSATRFFTTPVGGFEFDWTSVEPGVFTFTFPAGGRQVAASGVVSTDGNVIAYTGHADQFDVLAVGLRRTSGAALADLDGRWVAVELGAQLLDAGSEPFRTRFTAAYTGFDVDGSTGTLTYHTDGDVFDTDVTYNTQLATPTHVVSHTTSADDRGQTILALPDGSLRSSDLKFTGQSHPDSGALVASDIDLQAFRVSLLVAVKQPDTVPAATLDGDYHWAHLDLEPREDLGVGTTSYLDVDTGFGLFTATGGTAATLSLDSVTRATYSLTGLAPASNMTWTSADAVSDVTPLPAGVTLVLDAAGNHRGDAGARFFGVSGDGDIVLSVAPGEGGRVLRGIGVGLK